MGQRRSWLVAEGYDDNDTNIDEEEEDEEDEEEDEEEEEGRLWDNLCESRIRKLAQPPHPTKVCSRTCFLPAKHTNHHHLHRRNHPR